MWPRRRARNFALPKVARGLACGDFDRDGDIDLLVTRNGDGAFPYCNDLRPRTVLSGCGWSEDAGR
jgi:hypothetical protein